MDIIQRTEPRAGECQAKGTAWKSEMSGIRLEILTAAIERFGPAGQIDKAVEELSELIRALARMDDWTNIAEEMADVRIMLDQLELIFRNHDDVRAWEMKKLTRLDMCLHAADRVE